MNMRDVVEGIFGSYSPVLSDVFNDAGEYVGSTIAPGLASVDWTWISGVVVFCIMLIAFFKIVGRFLK